MTHSKDAPPQHVAVIDIGKTNVKLALVDLSSLSELAVMTRTNTVLDGPPWPHYDVDGHWAFLMGALSHTHRNHRVDAISITTHGACAALLDDVGNLAAPILDYEHCYPEDIVDAYDSLKPDFAETGSPKLPGGLNIGAQLHWQFKTDPTLKERTARIVTYPQYWGHRLTGVAATDVTSLGCHTDLWNPHLRTFSTLAGRLGIRDKIAPVRRPNEILGPILPHIARITRLNPDTPVSVGIHDSNASLYPHIASQDGPFSIVSTGTWVVIMSSGSQNTPFAGQLDPARDTLVNVSALNHAVPSARFMGGREYEIIQQGQSAHPSAEDVKQVLADQQMLMPSVQQGSGPFQGRQMQWKGGEPAIGSGQRSAALSFYLALMTGTCLKLVSGDGPTIVEGPFAQNAEYIAMLSAITGRPIATSSAVTGTSVGAALLFAEEQSLPKPALAQQPTDTSAMLAYADMWSRLTG